MFTGLELNIYVWILCVNLEKNQAHSSSPSWLNHSYNFMLTAWWLIRCKNVIPVFKRSADTFGKNISLLFKWHVLFCYYYTEYNIYNTGQELQSLWSSFPQKTLFIKRPYAKIFHTNSQYSVLEKLQCCSIKVIIKVFLISVIIFL